MVRPMSAYTGEILKQTGPTTASLNIRFQGGYYVDQKQSMLLTFECDPAAEDVRPSSPLSVC